jgi:hypothetical protein
VVTSDKTELNFMKPVMGNYVKVKGRGLFQNTSPIVENTISTRMVGASAEI